MNELVIGTCERPIYEDDYQDCYTGLCLYLKSQYGNLYPIEYGNHSIHNELKLAISEDLNKFFEISSELDIPIYQITDYVKEALANDY